MSDTTNSIAFSMSCEGVELQISSDELTFTDLEDKFYSMLERIPKMQHKSESEAMFK